MKIPFYHRISGYYRIHTTENYKTRLQNLLYVLRIPNYKEENGDFLIPRREKDMLLSAAKRERLPLSVGTLCGAPQYLKTHKHRIGIPIGVLLGALLVFLGVNTVWRVEISGNENLSDERIEADLATLGFGVGSSNKGESYDGLISAYRLLHPEIAWMGIYTQGTTAYVRVIENERREESSFARLPSHLVAGQDAVIEKSEILHGTSVVKRGSVVKKGDILVLGLANGKDSDHIMAAEGKVFGRVCETISVKIPLVIEEKKELFRKTEAFSLNFFQKTINIFKKNNTNTLDYVIIERKEVFRLFNGLALPLGYTVKEAVFYSVEKTTLKESELVREGMLALDAKLRNTVGEGELLSKKIRIEKNDGSLCLYATVEYTKNIAERLPFQVGGR